MGPKTDNIIKAKYGYLPYHEKKRRYGYETCKYCKVKYVKTNRWSHVTTAIHAKNKRLYNIIKNLTAKNI